LRELDRGAEFSCRLVDTRYVEDAHRQADLDWQLDAARQGLPATRLRHRSAQLRDQADRD
jgi:hypothetical protein